MKDCNIKMHSFFFKLPISFLLKMYMGIVVVVIVCIWDRCGRDRMYMGIVVVVIVWYGFTTIYPISSYHH